MAATKAIPVAVVAGSGKIISPKPIIRLSPPKSKPLLISVSPKPVYESGGGEADSDADSRAARLS